MNNNSINKAFPLYFRFIFVAKYDFLLQIVTYNEANRHAGQQLEKNAFCFRGTRLLHGGNIEYT